MSDQELSKVYDPEQVEARWYARWRDSGYFQPSADRARPPFTVVLPPPNVTGRLHMGHALTATIEDTLVRWHRMRGYDALWLPGTDHAGIATQMMVERQLASEGTSRQAIGREAFLERTWAWKEEHGGVIDQQHERLGASLDWSRYRFTMDEVSSRAVREAFVRLHEEGLVYRDYRLINWDWGSQTAVSDLEVEPREVEGKLWHLAYPVEGSEDTLVVATTRPETMLGDSGIAVHPEDPRYQHLVGRSVVLPITGRKIPIVADPILVDMSFGTGAVKVTPAHDFNDFETGKRHDLELIQIIDLAGKVCAPAPERFVGLDVPAARTAVLAELDAAGVVVKVEPHTMKVGHSQRSGVVVEPLPSTQWFVKVGPLAEPAIAAVREGRTRIIPEHRNADYFRWMENIHDWCISRQLWWGHRIPAWYCEDCGHVTVAREDPSRCASCESANIRQDEDVLDTWFSSGLWPLTTLGWPDNEDDVAHFYPTSLMETGWDILFFWVARMMMFGIHFGGDVPFRTVFLHSMVLGEDGRKMSKTKGNVVDPVELIEEYGTDALRFYLATMGGQEHGIVFSRARVEGYRNFCNKLWNASRFAQMKLEGYDPARFSAEILEPRDWEALAPQDRWILARAVETCVGVDDELSSWRLDLAAHRLYQFVWHELCDWYLELAKENLREDADPRRRLAAQGTLATVLDLVLRALHPFTPFVTEEIWTRLPGHEGAGPSLMLADYPEPERDDEGRRSEPLRLRGPLCDAGDLLASPSVSTACEAVELAVGIITRRRNLAAGYRIPPAKRVDLVLRCGDPALRSGLEALHDAICFVGRVGRLDFIDADAASPAQAASDVVGKVELFIPLEGLVDVGAERARMAREIDKRVKEIAGLEGKLANPGFVGKAPPEVVDKERARLEELREQLGRQRELLSRLGD